MKNTNTQIAEVFKALGDENRIRIIKILQGGERCANDILEELEVTQPTLSHHMRILCETELVVWRKEGKKVIYTLSHENTDAVLRETRELLQTYSFRRRDDDIVIL